MSDRSPIQRVLDKFGGSPSRVAAALGGKVRRQHVEHWVKAQRVPADYCPDLEVLAGVACEELRPDVNWLAIRGTAVAAAGEGA